MANKEADNHCLPSSPEDCGHFHLPLLLLTEDIDKGSVDSRYKSISEQLVNETGDFRHSLSNMLGLIEFKKGEATKACQKFTEILEQDPINLNALANLAHVYGRMNRTSKAEEYSSRLREVFEGHGNISEEEKQVALIRCLAEQGYSLAFDCYDEKTRMPPKCDEAHSLYALVLNESENITPLKSERLKWMMCLVVSRYRQLNKKYLWNKSGEGDTDVIDEAVALLQRLKHIVDHSEDGFYQAQSWCYIGMLLMRGRYLFNQRKPDEHRSTLEELDLINCHGNPMLCFQAAETCHEHSWKLMVNSAKAFIDDKRFDDALKVIEKSLSMNPSMSNWHAYQQRANVYIKMYDEQVQKGRRVDKKSLRQAATDLDLCLSSSLDYNPTIVVEMVKVQIRLGAKPRRWLAYEVEDMDAIGKALDLLTKLQDQVEDDYNNYLKLYGDCLMYVEEYSEAAVKYEKALQAGNVKFMPYSNFACLITSLFFRLRQCQQTGESSEDCKAAIVTKFKQYHAPYDKGRVQKTLGDLSKNFRREFPEVDGYAVWETGMSLRDIAERSGAS
ncbi:tetratricopeptide repeat protein 22-like [Ptychodera flava]|uniref:tetratricopeptide repeat protein 22-like n=1 Tax=Ptychodera flava TaxID=63121 RepID=UPI00396A97A5